jgi:flagellar export protein FliJ
MAKYRFRLQTLLRLRETHRDEKRGRLAEAYQAEAILSEQQQEVNRELHQLQQLQRDSLTTTQTNINRLIEVQRHQLTLRAQQGTMHKQAEILTAEIERRHQDLVDSDRQVRVLEKLQHRQREKHRQDMQRKEAKEYDDLGQLRCDAWNGQNGQPAGKVET